MPTLPTQEEKNNKQRRQKNFQELRTAAEDWINYNKKTLTAQIDFLTDVKNKRGDKMLSTAADNIKPLLIKNLREFLS